MIRQASDERSSRPQATTRRNRQDDTPGSEPACARKRAKHLSDEARAIEIAGHVRWRGACDGAAGAQDAGVIADEARAMFGAPRIREPRTASARAVLRCPASAMRAKPDNGGGEDRECAAAATRDG